MEYKIIVFGANGRLGARLVEAFQKEQQVECIKCVPNQIGEVDFRRYDGKHINLETILPRRNNVRYILINCAAYTNLVEYDINRSLARTLNILIPKKLNNYRMKRNDLKIIHFSTDAFYSNGFGVEDEILCLYNDYCIDKYLAERELISDSENLIFRLNFFGKSLGKPSFSDYILHRAKCNLPVILTQCRFSPVSIDTIFHVIKYSIEYRLGGVFNLCTSYNYSKREFSERLLKFQNSGFKPRIEEKEDGNKSKNMSMSNRKLLNAIKDDRINTKLNMNLEQAFEIEYKKI